MTPGGSWLPGPPMPGIWSPAGKPPPGGSAAAAGALASVAASGPPSTGSGAWKATSSGFTTSAYEREITNTTSEPSRCAKVS